MKKPWLLASYDSLQRQQRTADYLLRVWAGVGLLLTLVRLTSWLLRG